MRCLVSPLSLVSVLQARATCLVVRLCAMSSMYKAMSRFEVCLPPHVMVVRLYALFTSLGLSTEDDLMHFTHISRFLDDVGSIRHARHETMMMKARDTRCMT
jgi:hypothetical protein